VAGLVQPGDRVDIIALTALAKTDPLTGEEKPNVISGYIAQDIEILAVSQRLVKVIPNIDERAKNANEPGLSNPASSASTSGAAAKPDDKAETYEKAISVTLAMKPDDAAKISLIDAMKKDQGQYRLLARQKGDTAQLTGTISWTLDDVIPTPKKK
jgi:Flp pilus assembly protein CpaB